MQPPLESENICDSPNTDLPMRSFTDLHMRVFTDNYCSIWMAGYAIDAWMTSEQATYLWRAHRSPTTTPSELNSTRHITRESNPEYIEGDMSDFSCAADGGK